MLKQKVKSILLKKRIGYKVFRFYKNFSLSFISFSIRDIVICGVQRSGSTLIFNYTKEILNYKNNNIDTFFSDDRKYKNILESEYSGLLKKTHSYSSYIAKRIRKKQSIGIFTYRDIRDVLVSAIQKGWISSPDDWISNNRLKIIMHNAIMLSKVPNMLIFSYSDLINNPEKIISKISERMDYRLRNSKIDTIIDKYSINNVKSRMKQIPTDKKLNYMDQFHKNHIADAKTGKWKNFFSKKDIDTINKYCKEYLDYFGFEK